MYACDMSVFDVHSSVKPLSTEVSLGWQWFAVKYIDVEICELSPVACYEVCVDIFHGVLLVLGTDMIMCKKRFLRFSNGLGKSFSQSVLG